jgi:CRISPR-associated endonuclease Cas1
MTKKVLLIDDYGAFLSSKQGMFVLKKKDSKIEVSAADLDSIVFSVKGASISAASIALAAEFGIDIVFLDKTKPIARLLPYSYGTLMKTWLKQLIAYRKSKIKFAKSFVLGKIYNQRQVLMEFSRRFQKYGKSISLEKYCENLKERIDEIEKAKDLKDLLSIESHAAKSYWEAVSLILPKEIGFKHRYTRSNPPLNGKEDPFNIALNIGYAALRKEVWRAVYMAGLNPYLGFYHIPRGTRPSLVLDLMEEFRAVAVDRPLISLARNETDKILKIKSSSESIKEIWSYVVNYMVKASNPNHKSPTYPDLIISQARKLASAVKGESEYKPFLSSW